MKVQSYYYSKTGNAQELATRIAREYKVKADQIPPAYQPERETVVFISFESGKLEEKLVTFCKSLTIAKARHVALAVVGPDTTGLDELRSLISSTGVEVLDDTFHAAVKGGFLKKGKISSAQLDEGLAWSKKIVDSFGLE